jgi:hypothetical protein
MAFKLVECLAGALGSLNSELPAKPEKGNKPMGGIFECA